MRSVNSSRNTDMKTFADVHGYSVGEPDNFWSDVWDFGDIRAQTRGDRVLVDRDKMPGAQFFPDAKLNFTQNLLRRNDDTPAMIFRGEDKVGYTVSWRRLNDQVSRLHQAFRDFEVGLSDISGFALSPLFAWAVGGVLLATFIQTFAVQNRRSAFVSDTIACGAGVIALTIYTIGAIVPFASLMQSLR